MDRDDFTGILAGIIISILLFVSCIVYGIIKYNNEDEHKVYVEWVVYDHGNTRCYSNTYNMKGNDFKIHNYWQSAGKYKGSYRVVEIVSASAGFTYWGKEVVCIYTGINDVEVKQLKIVE